MALHAFGDAALSFQLSRQNLNLKTGLNQFSSELSSGKVSDRSRALGGETSRLSGIEHSLKLLSAYRQTTRETAQIFAAAQSTLTSVDETRASLSSDLLLISRNSPEFLVTELAHEAVSDFTEIVAKLNTRIADRTIFGGAAVERAALTDATTMLDDLESTIGLAPTASDIKTVVKAWFEDPAGGFAMMGFTGDSGDSPTRVLNGTAEVAIDMRADDPAIRKLLQATAIAAMVDRFDDLSGPDKANLLQESGLQLQSAAVGVAQLQAQIGFVEQEVERASTENSAQNAALSIQLNERIGADPFETATALQSLQVQLETHYAMTARLSRLSLVEYLR